MSYSNGPRIITDRLSLYLDAANSKSYSGSGNTWFDISGNNLNAIKAGTQSPTYPQYNYANKGYFSFSGGIVANNYSRFEVANIPSFSNLSIFIWFKTGDTSTNDQTLLRMDNSDFQISIYNTTQMWYAAGTNYNDINRVITTSSAPTNNVWHCAGLTFNGIDLKCYYDNILVGSNTRGSSTTTAAGTLKIGTRDDNYLSHYVGNISNIQIYNKVLSINEIVQNYNAIKGRFNL